MRTEAAQGRVGHVHEAGFYTSDAEFLALIVPFVTGGIAAGEPVIIGYDDRKCDLLRAELPRPDAVSFIADTHLYATPAGAIDAYRQQFERHVAAGAEQIRIAGDVPHEGNGGRFAGWDRYESAVNVVWQDYPVYSRCLYDATTVADRVRDVVERTHRRVLIVDGAVVTSPRYQEVADFERLPPAADPLEATPPTVALIGASPRKTRHQVAEAAHGRIDAATDAGVAVRGLGSCPQRAPAWTAADHREVLDGSRPDRGPRARRRPRTGRPAHRPRPRPLAVSPARVSGCGSSTSSPTSTSISSPPPTVYRPAARRASPRPGGERRPEQAHCAPDPHDAFRGPDPGMQRSGPPQFPSRIGTRRVCLCTPTATEPVSARSSCQRRWIPEASPGSGPTASCFPPQPAREAAGCRSTVRSRRAPWP